MALVTCKECKRQISDVAKVCPKCGYDRNIEDRQKEEEYWASAEGMKKKKTKNWILSIAVIGCLYFLFSCVRTLSENASNYDKDVQLCIEKGIKYYKELGSYPKLSSGKNAERAAEEKCARTTGAFDPLGKSK